MEMDDNKKYHYKIKQDSSSFPLIPPPLSSTLSLFNLIDNINKGNALLPSIEYYVSD